MASVQERANDGGQRSWAVLYRQGSKQRSKTYKSKKAADKLKALIDQFGPDEALEMIGAKSKAASRMTLDELADLWFNVRQNDVDAGDLTPRVLTGYRRDYANWISPWLGHMHADEVKDVHVQNWVDQMRGAPKSAAKSIADRHSILYSIFKWGSHGRRDYVPENPCIGTDLPKRHRKPPKGLRPPELHALIETGRRIKPDAADLIAFMAGTGWRVGEAVALTAGQVEDDGTSVYVTMGRVWRREVGFVESAKSDAGMRRLRVLGPGVPVLRRRLVGLGMGDLVFTTEAGYAWDESSFRKRDWRRIVNESGLAARGPTPHWLRHSHVLLCHAAGMSMAEISRRVGHSDIKTTINVYGRLIDDMPDDVAARLDALLTPGALPEIIQARALK